MIIIPAIDIKGGKCVRLEQGLMNKETIFSDNPEEMAFQWERKGAKRNPEWGNPVDHWRKL